MIFKNPLNDATLGVGAIAMPHSAMSIKITQDDKGCFQLINKVVKIIVSWIRTWFQMQGTDCQLFLNTTLTAIACKDVCNARSSW